MLRQRTEIAYQQVERLLHATVNADAVSGSLAVDKTEALSTETINWTMTGQDNGDVRYYYEWTDQSASSPTGSWTTWDQTTNQSWWLLMPVVT